MKQEKAASYRSQILVAIWNEATGWGISIVTLHAAAILRQRAGRLARAQVAPRAVQNGVPGGLKKLLAKTGFWAALGPPSPRRPPPPLVFTPGAATFRATATGADLAAEQVRRYEFLFAPASRKSS